MQPSTSLFELLHNPANYAVFERYIFVRGWVSDIELKALREADSFHLGRAELLRLVECHERSSEILEFDLYATELLCEGRGQICFLFNRRIFGTLDDLVRTLRLYGFAPKDSDPL